jgi:chromosome segregation ATPase
MSIISIVDCSDLYDNAAERLKGLDNDIDKTIQDLAKKVEARGVPKNKVARQVVKELTAREVLSPSRIYKGLGSEHKRKYKKREIEETFPQGEIISTEESSTNQQIIQVAATRIGQSETLKEMNGRPDIKLVSEEQKQMGALRQQNESLKEKERENEREKSELIKKIAYLRKEYARLKSKNEELEKQLTEKTEQVGELKSDNESLKEKTQPELFQELQEKFYDQPRLIDAKKLQKISMESGKNLEIMLERYNSILQDAIDSGQPVPVGTYIITKPDMKLVPIGIHVDFDKRKIKMSL